MIHTGNFKGILRIKHISIKYWPWIFGTVLVLLYVFPWILAGESGYIRIHDSLDSHMAWQKVMAEQKSWFASNLTNVGLIGEVGLPRVSYPKEFSVVTFLFALLNPYWAYVVNQIILRIIAIFGMYVFLCNIISEKRSTKSLITFGVALCYAFLPYWAWTGAVASLPWIMYAVIRIWQGKLGSPEIIILSLYPFYSSIIVTGMYVIELIWVLVIISVILGHHYRSIFIAAVITTISHLIADYRLLNFSAFGGFIPHRVDFKLTSRTLSDAWSSTLDIFQNGDWAVTFHAPIIYSTILSILIVSLLYGIWSRVYDKHIVDSAKPLWWKKQKVVFSIAFLFFFFILFFFLNDPVNPIILKTIIIITIIAASIILLSIHLLKLVSQDDDSDNVFWSKNLYFILSLVTICFIISLLCGFWDWKYSISLRENIQILKVVNFTRISFFLPFLWMIAFAFALVQLSKKIPFANFLLIPALLFMQLTIELHAHEYFAEKRQTGITYKQFFSKPLFDRIAKILPGERSSYVIGCVGIHPSIAQYNGFRTADGYLPLYPQDYKVKFRKAVVKEFSRRADLISYFDEWGSRFYFFTAEMLCPRNGSVCIKTTPQVTHLDYNVSAMRELGVKYLFSVPIILNSNELGLTLIGTYEKSESAWDIRVYRLPNLSKEVYANINDLDINN